MKKVFFGVAVVAIALAGSAFTNAKIAEGDLYLQTTANQFTKSSTGVYDPASCDEATVDFKCGYRVTAAGASIVTGPFNEIQAASYLSASPALIVPVSGSANGIYTP